MTYEFEHIKEPHRCINGLGGSRACTIPAHFRVGTSANWRRREYGGGILFHTCADHLPADARRRDSAPPADSTSGSNLAEKVRICAGDPLPN
jgi:hypothetical protein